MAENKVSGDPSNVFMDQKQILAAIPVSRGTLLAWERAGKIPTIRMGGKKSRVLYHWPSVERAILQFNEDLSAERAKAQIKHVIESVQAQLNAQAHARVVARAKAFQEVNQKVSPVEQSVVRTPEERQVMPHAHGPSAEHPMEVNAGEVTNPADPEEEELII